MKLSKSKLALAKVINENGGWPDSGNYAVQQDSGGIWTSNSKPKWIIGGFRFSMSYCCHIVNCELINNRNQAVLSREEYYQAYPKADADGWIEWEGGKCPVDDLIMVEVKLRNHRSPDARMAKYLRWTHDYSISCADIIAYRLHKPEVKPEFCESVMRSIPDPEEKFSDSTSIPRINQCRCKMVDIKPTIEQLAQYYRDAKCRADRLQKEADEAAKVAGAKLVELELAGEELGLLIGVAKPTPELSITGWRDLEVGDIVFVDEMRRKSEWSSAMVGRECVVIEDGDNYPVCFANDFTPDGESYWIGGVDDGDITWRFIRRP